MEKSEVNDDEAARWTHSASMRLTLVFLMSSTAPSDHLQKRNKIFKTKMRLCWIWEASSVRFQAHLQPQGEVSVANASLKKETKTRVCRANELVVEETQHSHDADALKHAIEVLLDRNGRQRKMARTCRKRGRPWQRSTTRTRAGSQDS